jgi:DNA-binding FadR family transcriptional regulator
VAFLVAHRIVRDAMSAQLNAGDSLPPEHVMLEKYEIGRGTLREALRLLEFEGVITLKPGPKGGPILTTPDASHLASSLVLLMEVNKSPFRHVFEFRIGLEPMMCRLAASRIDDVSLKELRETITKMEENIDNQELHIESNRKFHDIIAWSSGNTLFGYVTESLLGIVDGTAVGVESSLIRRKTTLKGHKRILKAIENHDPDLAEIHMRAHLEDYVEFAERRSPESFNAVIPWEQTLNY